MNSQPANQPPGRLVPRSRALRERDERLDALVQFGGRLAHDFNNYLAPILGYLALAKEELAADSAALQYLKSMELSARRAERIVQELATACRANRHGERRITDLGKLIAEELDRWKTELPERAGIVVEQSLKPSSVHLNESQWRAAFEQLLRNARYALAAGGTVRVLLEPARLTVEEAAELGLPETEAFLLTMSDTGFGVPNELLSRAFEPFVTTRPKTQALGLGLTLVHAIVRSHGGQIVLESQENQGTTIRIWLPADGPSTDSIENSGKMAMAESVPRTFADEQKVLVMEDDALLLELIRSRFQDSNLEIVLAKDGDEGLRLYNKHAASIATVVCDITSPESKGFEMATTIREVNPQLPVLFLCSGAQCLPEARWAALPGPRPPLIQKPFQLLTLVQSVKALIA